jgi:hypothetical protein
MTSIIVRSIGVVIAFFFLGRLITTRAVAPSGLARTSPLSIVCMSPSSAGLPVGHGLDGAN